MLPSRGVLRSLSSARAANSISNQAISRSSRRLGDGRNFSSLRSTGGAAPWTALRSANSKIAGTVAVGGALESRRALSLWNRSKPTTEEAPAAAQAPPAPSEPVTPAATAPAPVTPAEPITTFSDAAPQATSNLADIDAASLLDLPEQIGYLKALGLDFGWGPSSVMQWFLEHVHVYSGLPWWGSIAATAVLLRLILLKPILKSQETSTKLQALQADPKYEEIKRASLEATSAGDTQAMMEHRRDLATLNKAAGVNPANALWGFIQIPFGYGMFRVLNGAASIPVPGMETGGFLWVTDLTVPDPLYILPIIGPITMFAMMRTAGANATPQQKAQQRLMIWILGPLSGIVTLYLPAAVQVYFVVTGAIGIAQNYALKMPAVRRAVGLPPMVTPSPVAAPHLSSAISTTGSYQAPRGALSPDPSQDGSIKGVIRSAKSAMQQTVHDAKGGAGSYVEAARKKQEALELAEYKKRREQKLKSMKR
ncbi:hypothetical protein CkaCkLH20_07641 [Colletotrichum karsti]|uniref:Membrane insertase YidC/Oxa/ALB C-terminal domain-containing protein n=1 Tax=Colletotrichum karsti TaxID=1095194 RepID=A0A9P6I0Y3_9PEZI|nr:uncharacterized protein CkaCkLH20_07641 [Colletotrichum karsti]KAF9874947.1 hypothetical protein CkaCkLH20_07641 [Colletotrichum karsti]